MATQSVGALRVMMEAAHSRYVRSVSKMQKSNNTFNRQTQRGFRRSNKAAGAFTVGMKRMLVATIAVAGPAVLGALVKRSLDAADGLAKTADKVGLTTDELQEMRFAAKQSGVEISALDVGMQRWSRRLGEAANRQGVLFKTLKDNNVALRDQNGRMRSSMDILNDYADLIGRTDDQQEKLLLTFQAFDTEGAALVNLLGDGSEKMKELRAEARSLGLVLDENLLRGAESVSDAMGRLGDKIKVVADGAILELAPEIEEVVDSLLDVVPLVVEFLKELDPERMKAAGTALAVLTGLVVAYEVAMTIATIATVGLGAALGGPIIIAALAAIGWALTEVIDLLDIYADRSHGIDRTSSQVDVLTNSLVDLLKATNGGKNASKEQASQIRNLREQINELTESNLDLNLGLETTESKLKDVTKDMRMLQMVMLKAGGGTDEQKEKLAKYKSEIVALQKELWGVNRAAELNALLDGAAERETAKLIKSANTLGLISLPDVADAIDIIARSSRAMARDIADPFMEAKTGAEEFAQSISALNDISNEMAAGEIRRIDEQQQKKEEAAERSRALRVEEIEALAATDAAAAVANIKDADLLAERLQEIEDTKNDSLAASNQTFQDAVIKAQQKAADQEADIRRKQKPFLIAQAIANTAVAITQVLPNIPLAVLIGVAGAIQVANIMATKFATGGSGMVTGTGGTDSQFIPVMATPGERITVQTPGQQAAGIFPGSGGVGGNQFVQHLTVRFDGITPEQDLQRRIMPGIERAARDGFTEIITVANIREGSNLGGNLLRTGKGR